MARAVTEEEKAIAQGLLGNARAAMRAMDSYDQNTVDNLCRAVSWATANEKTFVALTQMSVDESKMGSAEGGPARRFKIVGILRDALRQKSIGVIEEMPEKGIVKYAKPAGVIAGLLPGDQSGGHDGRDGDQRFEVQGCGDFLAASREQAHRARNHTHSARRP